MNKADTLTTGQRIDTALRIASEIVEKDPTDSTTSIVVEQLRYLQEIYRQEGNLKTVPKGKMTIGIIAAREYDPARPQLADLLYKIDWVLDHGE